MKGEYSLVGFRVIEVSPSGVGYDKVDYDETIYWNGEKASTEVSKYYDETGDDFFEDLKLAREAYPEYSWSAKKYRMK